MPDDFDHIAPEEIADLFEGLAGFRTLLRPGCEAPARQAPPGLGHGRTGPARASLEGSAGGSAAHPVLQRRLPLGIGDQSGPGGREGFPVQLSLLRRTLLDGGFVEISIEAAHVLAATQLPPLH